MHAKQICENGFFRLRFARCELFLRKPKRCGFRDADMRAASLWNARLEGADFTNANLEDADLDYAKLRAYFV